MKIGTKSLLFGVHQFLLHPLCVAAAWWKLFGFPWDPRLWLAFFLHDVGYWGCNDMDGPAGADHPERGARWMHWLFDWPRWLPFWLAFTTPAGRPGRSLEYWFGNTAWYDFCRYHSRHYARRHGHPVSQLCLADKYSIVLTPAWLYLPMARLTGELAEYMANGKQARERGVQPEHAALLASDDPRNWLEGCRRRMYAWVAYRLEHGELVRNQEYPS
jgi:hypothetical protein